MVGVGDSATAVRICVGVEGSFPALVLFQHFSFCPAPENTQTLTFSVNCGESSEQQLTGAHLIGKEFFSPLCYLLQPLFKLFVYV